MDKTVFETTPAVFAVGSTYEIMVPVLKETVMWVKVGENCFYDDANGTLRSAVSVHRMTVPSSLLDREKKYSVCYRVIKKRKPYFTECEDECRADFEFFPISDDPSRAFLIADAHNEVRAPLAALAQFEKKHGNIDFLILGGDIPMDCGRVENFSTIYRLIEGATHGNKPVVYAKGNHDLRGIYAEKLDEATPLCDGHTYFTFRLGNIWGICLDCGEDKRDSNAEYGHTVCCHAFRERETEYIKGVIENAEGEYLAPGVEHRIIVSHIPFHRHFEPPFDIEEDIYAKWCELLKKAEPEMMICGHTHELEIDEAGCENDRLGQPCTVVIGSRPYKNENGEFHFYGSGFFFSKNGIGFEFINDLGESGEPTVCKK